MLKELVIVRIRDRQLSKNLEAVQYLHSLSTYNIIGIDIGRDGQIATSLGAKIYSTNDASLKEQLDYYLRDHDINAVALERHIRFSATFKNKNKGLLHVSEMIQRICKQYATRVVCILVDPFKSSLTCSRCKMVDARSKSVPWSFQCTTCGIMIDPDVNAARNIKDQAELLIEGNRV